MQVKTNLTTKTCLKTIIAHDNEVNVVIKISITQIVSGSKDKSIKVRNLINGTCLFKNSYWLY